MKRISANKIDTWDHLKNLNLADPKHLDYEDIDLLIGIVTYAEIVEAGVVKGNPSEPIAQKTKIGWIICGGDKSDQKTHATHIVATDCLMDQIKIFWELEEMTPKKLLSNSE